MSEKYKDKKVSIIGDSISTLPGYIPEGYAVYYDVENKNTDVHTPQDTWWGMLLAKLGATLLEDNAYSGSMVSRYPLQNTLFPSASSDERTSALHRGDEKPDVIIIYIGINDWNECLMPDREHVYPEDKRPEEYRERSRDLWVRYGLYNGRGKNVRFLKDDISVLITAVVIDRFLVEGGIMSFVLRQAIFKSEKNGARFRRFRLGDCGAQRCGHCLGIQKQQVAYMGGVSLGALVVAGGFPLQPEGFGTGVKGDILYPCVVQAEGCEHG
jgi:hypothetical protein